MNDNKIKEDMLETHNKIQEYYNVEQESWSSVEQLAPGIFVYHDVLPKDMNIIKRLEEVLNNPSNYYNYYNRYWSS